MNQRLALQLRIAIMLVILVEMLFQQWNPPAEPDQPKRYLVEEKRQAPTTSMSCLPTAAEGGVCVTTYGTGGGGGDHTHTLSTPR